MFVTIVFISVMSVMSNLSERQTSAQRAPLQDHEVRMHGDKATPNISVVIETEASQSRDERAGDVTKPPFVTEMTQRSGADVLKATEPEEAPGKRPRQRRQVAPATSATAGPSGNTTTASAGTNSSLVPPSTPFAPASALVPDPPYEEVPALSSPAGENQDVLTTFNGTYDSATTSKDHEESETGSGFGDPTTFDFESEYHESAWPLEYVGSASSVTPSDVEESSTPLYSDLATPLASEESTMLLAVQCLDHSANDCREDVAFGSSSSSSGGGVSIVHSCFVRHDDVVVARAELVTRTSWSRSWLECLQRCAITARCALAQWRSSSAASGGSGACALCAMPGGVGADYGGGEDGVDADGGDDGGVRVVCAGSEVCALKACARPVLVTSLITTDLGVYRAETLSAVTKPQA